MKRLVSVLALFAPSLLAAQSTTTTTTCEREPERSGRVICKTVTPPVIQPGARTAGGGLAHALVAGMNGYEEGRVTQQYRAPAAVPQSRVLPSLRVSDEAAYARVEPIMLGLLRSGRLYLATEGADADVIRRYIQNSASIMYDAYRRNPQVSAAGLSEIDRQVREVYANPVNARPSPP